MHRLILMVEPLELRTLLSAAFDLIGVTALRNDPAFSTIDGGGVSVAVIDTGLDTTHPLIAPNFRAGANIVTGGTTPTVVNPHGTHVAGIVGARADSSRNFDGGVAPGVGLIGLNVFTQGAGGDVSASNRNIEKALQWVIDNRARYSIVAVNMSLGAGFFTSAAQVQGDVYRDEIQSLETGGVTVVSAAGNNYGIFRDSSTGQQFDVQFPNSAAPGIVSTLNVGAVWDANEGNGFLWGNGSVDLSTGADRITSFSQRPPTSVGNAIFAPGAIITSTWPGNQLQPTQGTSQASPMVAGAVALLQDAAQEFGGRLLSPAEVRSILQTNGDTIVDGDNEDDAIFIDSNGNGSVDSGELLDMTNTGLSYARLNIYKAVRAVRDLFGGGSTTGPDPNGTIGSAILGPTLSGAAVDPIRGTLGTDGTRNIGAVDVDMYQFTIASPGVVTIELASDTTSPADFDSFLRLFDSSGNQITSDDNTGAENFSQIKRTLGTGTYFVGVSGAGNTGYNPLTGAGSVNGATGNFVIGFSLRNDDPNGLISGAVNVNLAGQNEGPQVFNGFIGADFGKPVGVSDVDMFKIVVPDSGKLLVDIDTPSNSGFVNSFLRVFDSAGNPIGFNDNAVSTNSSGAATETSDGIFHYDASTAQAVGHASDSFAIVNVTRGDVFYFGVSDVINTSYDPNSLDGRATGGTGGTYTIFVAFANNDLNGAIPQAVDATALPFSGRLGAIGTDLGQQVGDRDVDIFRIRPTTDGILQIDVDSFSLSGNSDTVDAVLRLFDANGTLLATSDDVSGPDPILQISVPKNRDYYIGVSGKGNASYDPFVLGSGSPGQTGSYQLSVQVRSSSVASSLSDDTIGSAAIRSISFGNRQIGNIGMDEGFVRGKTDVDLYRFVAPSSGPVEARARTLTSFGADTFLRFLDANGTEIVANDNSDTATVDSRVQASVVAGRTYFISVSGSKQTTGEYALDLNGGFARASGGVLRVSGDGNDNTIRITLSGSRYKVFRDGSTLSFNLSAAGRVSVAAGDGDDAVTIGTGVVRATVHGEAGNDSITGGNSDDILIGNAGDDLISGGFGNDSIYGNEGADSLDGGSGNDRLVGGSGRDTVRAGDGNDTLLARDRVRDLLYGQSGFDSAQTDDNDYRSSIEELLA